MKKTLSLLALTMFVLTCIGQTNECSLRKVYFGITSSLCKTKETATFEDVGTIKGLKLISYSVRVFDLDARLTYIFANDTLTRAKYTFNTTYVNKNNYISDFNAVKDKLQEKYGKPISDKIYWINDLYKNDPKDYGLAISAGHVAYFTTFETDCMTIILVLQGENFEITSGVEYSSKKYNELEKRVKKNAEKDDY
ncbi:MAG: hypothetical protein WCH34_01275 [Bacteroidota bacterium]